MSGDIFDHQKFGAVGGRPVLLAALGNWWVEGRNAANHPTMHRKASHNKGFCKPSYSAQDSLSQQRILQTILQCTGQPLTAKNSANHPTVHRTASHNKELSGPKHQQCQGRETLGSISNHKVTLSFEVNIMMYSPNSGRFYQPHSWRISGNIRINYFWSTSLAPSKPS